MNGLMNVGHQAMNVPHFILIVVSWFGRGILVVLFVVFIFFCKRVRDSKHH